MKRNVLTTVDSSNADLVLIVPNKPSRARERNDSFIRLLANELDSSPLESQYIAYHRVLNKIERNPEAHNVNWKRRIRKQLKQGGIPQLIQWIKSLYRNYLPNENGICEIGTQQLSREQLAAAKTYCSVLASLVSEGFLPKR